jgi:hypothetical protein
MDFGNVSGNAREVIGVRGVCRSWLRGRSRACKVPVTGQRLAAKASRQSCGEELAAVGGLGLPTILLLDVTGRVISRLAGRLANKQLKLTAAEDALGSSGRGFLRAPAYARRSSARLPFGRAAAA